jgi:polyhydroxybutyrate depolymerase
MGKLVFVPVFCLASFLSAFANANERHMDVDGIKRSYALHVPAGIGPGAPLVVLLHGRGSSGEEEMARGRWAPKADKEKFIVAAPNALTSYDGVEPRRALTIRDWLRRGYRALRGRNLARWHGGANDVALIVSIIDRLGAEGKVDPARIYLVGFSRGGFMAHTLALEMTDRLAGVAVVSPDVEPEVRMPPRHPLSFLLVSGDQDPVHPITGDRPAATMERWRTINHCPPLARMDTESADLTVEGAGPCDQGTAIRYVIVHGVGHDWTAAAISYSDISWAFLSRFRRAPGANP